MSTIATLAAELGSGQRESAREERAIDMENSRISDLQTRIQLEN